MRKGKLTLGVILSLVLVFKQPLVQIAHAREEYSNRPPLNRWRIVGELAAGASGAVLGTAIGSKITYAMPASSEGAAWGHFLGGVFCGYVAGCTLGVNLVGNLGQETGSFFATLGGTVLGGLVGVGVLIGYGGDVYYRSEKDVFLPSIEPVLMSSMMATIGFNLTRRYKSSFKTGNALINFQDGRLRLGIPRVYLRPSSFDERNLIQNINLIRGRF